MCLSSTRESICFASPQAGQRQSRGFGNTRRRRIHSRSRMHNAIENNVKLPKNESAKRANERQVWKTSSKRWATSLCPEATLASDPRHLHTLLIVAGLFFVGDDGQVPIVAIEPQAKSAIIVRNSRVRCAHNINMRRSDGAIQDAHGAGQRPAGAATVLPTCRAGNSGRREICGDCRSVACCPAICRGSSRREAVGFRRAFGSCSG